MIGDDMKNKNGFTLVELLAVIAILGILMVFAVPELLSQLKKSKGDALNKVKDKQELLYKNNNLNSKVKKIGGIKYGRK